MPVFMRDNSIYLYWETDSKSDSQFFIVQRSTDAVMWEGIKTILGTYSYNTARQYFFIDSNITHGKYYYRLKQVNNDGMHLFSNAVSAEVLIDGADIYVTDSNGNEIQLHIGGLTNIHEWEVSALNATASIVMRPALLKAHVLNIPEVNSGIYLLKLQNKVNGKVKTIRFLKK